MSSIQDQIKALQRKQAAIDYYELIRKMIDTAKDPEGHEGIAKEVSEKLGKAIDAEILALHGNAVTAPKTSIPSGINLSEDDVRKFTLLFKSLAGGSTANSNLVGVSGDPGDVPLPPAPKKTTPHIDPNDPLRFLMAHKHFDGKTVIYSSPDGPVKGQVQGLDAPNIVLRLETGHTVAVSPIHCQIQK